MDEGHVRVLARDTDSAAADTERGVLGEQDQGSRDDRTNAAIYRNVGVEHTATNLILGLKDLRAAEDWAKSSTQVPVEMRKSISELTMQLEMIVDKVKGLL